MANFEAYRWNISLSANISFLKSAITVYKRGDGVRLRRPFTNNVEIMDTFNPLPSFVDSFT